MDDSAIIDLYFARSEKAIQETGVKYGNYLHTIAWSWTSGAGWTSAPATSGWKT